MLMLVMVLLLVASLPLPSAALDGDSSVGVGPVAFLRRLAFGVPMPNVDVQAKGVPLGTDVHPLAWAEGCLELSVKVADQQ